MWTTPPSTTPPSARTSTSRYAATWIMLQDVTHLHLVLFVHCIATAQCFAQSWGSVVCVSPSLPSLGAGSFCLMHICLIATRAEPVTELMLHSTYCGSKPFQHTSACNTVCNSQCLLIVHCLLCSCLSPDTVQHMRYPVNAVSSICIPSVCKVHSCAGE